LIQIENHPSPEKLKKEKKKCEKFICLFFFVLWVSGRVLFAPSVYFEKGWGKKKKWARGLFEKKKGETMFRRV
jgi:hypothetical protein